MLALSALALAVSPAIATGAPGSLTFVEQQKDGVGGVDGLDQAVGVTTSPDGRHVYATGVDDNAVVVFSRVSGSGALSFIEQQRDGVGGVEGLAGAEGVAVSPDGKNVYVTGRFDDAIAAFARNASSGALTFIGTQTDGIAGVEGLSGPRGVTVSPDGRSVYVAGFGDNSVVTFSRDPATGALTFAGQQQDGIGGVDGLNDAAHLVVTPDGTNAYATGNDDNSVAAFARDPATGALSFIGATTDGVGGVDGLNSAFGIASSPDARNIYVAGFGDSAVAAFARDSSTGALSFLGHVADGTGGVDGLQGALLVAVSPDGANVYATGRDNDAVASFIRDSSTGGFDFLEFDMDGVNGVDGLERVAGIDVACDGRSVHTASLDDDAVVVFSREGGAPGTCAPDLEFLATKQKIDKAVEATATCGLEACTVEVSGKLKGVRKKPNLRGDTEEVEFEEDQALSLGLGRRVRRKARAARREGEKVFAKLTATATDLAGNDALPETVKIKLK